ncbi:hypothetical protein [Halovenus salina]|uniref:ParB-like nuclease domain-containing protein n=1 Tax=Halovenus salina TaxID=1510225 RepID=A0ABD5VWJ8_9EURY
MAACRDSPEEVTYFASELRLNYGMGRVQGGDWDRGGSHRRMRESTLYRSLEQYFLNDVPWEETGLYERAAQQIKTTGQFRGYEILDAFRQVRCEYIDDLYRSISETGYRPNAAAGHEQATDNAFESTYANHLEPLVLVGRDGDIFLTEGSHRFTIASLLELESIPVNVLCRHVEWQQIRDRIAVASGDTFPEDLDAYHGHPDLSDITSC